MKCIVDIFSRFRGQVNNFGLAQSGSLPAIPILHGSLISMEINVVHIDDDFES